MNYNKVVIKNNLKVIGKFTLVHEDGREEEIDGKRSFCRCGLSSAMPFCDNTHQSKLKWVKKVKNIWKENKELKIYLTCTSKQGIIGTCIK